MRPVWPLLLLAFLGCQKQAPEAPRLKAPEPLPRLVPVGGDTDGGEAGREAIFTVRPFTPTGEGIPGKAARVVIEGSVATVNGAKLSIESAADAQKVVAALGGAPALLVAQGETWITHTEALLAALDAAKVEVWFLHPDANVAYQVTLRDAVAFGAWMEEPMAGKVRVIHRADGFEITTNMGKVMGGDPNGPSVPVRGGVMDLPTLQKGLVAVKGRFKGAPDVCFVPSFGTPLADAVRALAAAWLGTQGPVFGDLCLVYPKPGTKDAGK